MNYFLEYNHILYIVQYTDLIEVYLTSTADDPDVSAVDEVLLRSTSNALRSIRINTPAVATEPPPLQHTVLTREVWHSNLRKTQKYYAEVFGGVLILAILPEECNLQVSESLECRICSYHQQTAVDWRSSNPT